MNLLDVRLIAITGLAMSFSLGCNVGPDNSFADLQPLVFPSEGRLGTAGWGSTAAVVIDSNYLDFADDWEFHDLHKSRVKINVTDPSVTKREPFQIAPPETRLSASGNLKTMTEEHG